jgi:hypothetical protein
MYGNEKEMEKVIGDWRDNEFILEAKGKGELFQKDSLALLENKGFDKLGKRLN